MPIEADFDAFQLAPEHGKPKRFGVSYCLAKCQSRRSSMPSSSRRTTRGTQALRLMRYYSWCRMRKNCQTRRNFVLNKAKLASVGSRRRTRNPSASISGILFLNAKQRQGRRLSGLASARHPRALRSQAKADRGPLFDRPRSLVFAARCAGT